MKKRARSYLRAAILNARKVNSAKVRNKYKIHYEVDYADI